MNWLILALFLIAPALILLERGVKLLVRFVDWATRRTTAKQIEATLRKLAH